MVRHKNTRSTAVYWLFDSLTSIPFYCGKSVLPLPQRHRQHQYEAKHGTRRVHAKVRQCGENFVIVQVESVPPDGDWGRREKYWIRLIRMMNPNACNTADGGAGTPGRILSEATKAKLSAKFKGKPMHTPETKAWLRAIGTGKKRSPESVEKGRLKMKGRKLTPEFLAILSAAQKARYVGERGEQLREAIGLRRKGVKASDETRAKQRAAKLGKKRTPEQCARQSAAHMGKKMSPESIAKSAASRTGGKRTPEQRARMSAARKGRKWSQAQRDKIPAGLLASWKRRKSA